MNPTFWCGMVSTILRDYELGEDIIALMEKNQTIPHFEEEPANRDYACEIPHIRL
jgi:hypothetical protein